MSKKKSTHNVNLAVEAALSVFRWTLLFVILNNVLWAGIHFGDIKQSPSNNTEIHMTQDGTGNNQSFATPEANLK